MISENEIVNFREELFLNKKEIDKLDENNIIPFLIINPYGLKKYDFLKKIFYKYQINPLSEIELKNWVLISSLMYIHHFEDNRIKRAIKFKLFWTENFSKNICKIWFLDENTYKKVLSNKIEIRNIFEIDKKNYNFNEKFNSFHVPDVEHLKNDFLVVKYFMSLL